LSYFLFKLFRENEAAQLIEFAISLPLLMVLVVGIYDFGGAFVIKHKVGSATLEGARFASNQPSNDLSNNSGCGAPGTISAIRDVVHGTLANNSVDDCGLGTASISGGDSDPTHLMWTFKVSCPGDLKLQIERGVNNITATLPAPFEADYHVEATRVT